MERETQNLNKQVKVKAEGDPCRHCGTAVVKKFRSPTKAVKKSYYYEWTLYCPKCSAIYLQEEAKRFGRPIPPLQPDPLTALLDRMANMERELAEVKLRLAGLR